MLNGDPLIVSLAIFYYLQNVPSGVKLNLSI